MTEREQMIQLLKDAYEDLELSERDGCECDPSVGLQCYPCRLRDALHRFDPGWTCAADEQYESHYHYRCTWGYL